MAEAAAPKVQALKCSACGAPVELRSPQTTVRVACSYCGSVLDAKTPGLEIVQRAENALKVQLIIPLGKRGDIRGEKMECIGMMRRRVVVEGMLYDWAEYLLWNPFKGFRYLSEYNGHWNYIKVTHQQPKLGHSAGGAEEVEYLGKTYKHFQSAQAKVIYVVGEFSWQVATGDTAAISDFVNPPLIVSREADGHEITWSVGEYISPEQVWKGFALAGTPRETVGVAPSEVWPHEARHKARMMLWGIFGIVAVILHLFFAIIAQDKKVMEKDFVVNAADAEKSRVTDVFELEGRTSNVRVDVACGVSNNWAFFSMALINDKTGDAFDFAREVSYYQGVEDGESWSEGSTNDTAYLPSVPPGSYYLRVEPEAGTWPIAFTVKLTRDVALWRWPMLALLLLSVPPLWLTYRRRSFEYQRWLESDHPMDPLIKFNTSDDED